MSTVLNIQNTARDLHDEEIGGSSVLVLDPNVLQSNNLARCFPTPPNVQKSSLTCFSLDLFGI